ncbi:hypothetical protein BJ508DRAFT_381529 [Ascobolus immersus RN42]|uniref:Uncharacterized protein n=1 Tax=Ascobolus immersus RN42 TaxID=1160509 RepID=A0A3N4HIK0_ASCIM|nr:hypothetical protein BJ508DRAFT_381529 [Ascobolus immersus RN42]
MCLYIGILEVPSGRWASSLVRQMWRVVRSSSGAQDVSNNPPKSVYIVTSSTQYTDERYITHTTSELPHSSNSQGATRTEEETPQIIPTTISPSLLHVSFDNQSGLPIPIPAVTAETAQAADEARVMPPPSSSHTRRK